MMLRHHHQLYNTMTTTTMNTITTDTSYQQPINNQDQQSFLVVPPPHAPNPTMPAPMQHRIFLLRCIWLPWKPAVATTGVVAAATVVGGMSMSGKNDDTTTITTMPTFTISANVLPAIPRHHQGIKNKSPDNTASISTLSNGKGLGAHHIGSLLLQLRDKLGEGACRNIWSIFSPRIFHGVNEKPPPIGRCWFTAKEE